MQGRFTGLTDPQWELIYKLLPPQPKRVGKPGPDFRKVLNTILYVEITGCRWCDVPEGDSWGKRSTAHKWLGIFKERGVWDNTRNSILSMADLAKQIDWSKGAVDGSFPPGKGGGQDIEYGYKCKGVTTHLLVEGSGMPLSATVTGASGSERDQVAELFKRVNVYHGYGRPKRCPHQIHADKGYDSKALRFFLRNKGIRPVIPKRKWRAKKQPRGPKISTSKDRWKVERCFAWMQRKYRRLTVRWERQTKYWNGFLQLSVIMMWIDKLICG